MKETLAQQLIPRPRRRLTRALLAGGLGLAFASSTVHAQDATRQKQTPPNQPGGTSTNGAPSTRLPNGNIQYGGSALSESVRARLEQFNRNRQGFYSYYIPGNRNTRPNNPNRPLDNTQRRRLDNIFANGIYPVWWLMDNGLYGTVIGGFGVPNNAFFYSGWGSLYFPNSWAYYPYYYPGYVNGATVLSPFSYYYNQYPPYIGIGNVLFQPPPVVYVPVPVYINNVYQGWNDQNIEEYYLNRRQREREQEQKQKEKQDTPQENTDKPEKSKKSESSTTALTKALNDIQRAWRTRDIELLTRYIEPKGKIAVMLRGKYQYSLEPGDYIDMTRDVFRTTTTDKFELGKPSRQENGIYTVSGRHVYRDKNEGARTVFISYALEKKGDQFYITQVGTAPDRIEE